MLNPSFIFLISLLTANFHTSNSYPNHVVKTTAEVDDIRCKGIQKSHDKCSYVKSHEGCNQMGYIPYLQLFFCTFSPVPGYISLILWLVLLFYLLGDTASNYFCSSLEGLSKILKLSPTIAGTTLLSLGNGAPDVFAGIISFTGNGTSGIGLNSILGAVFFVSCVVVGIISISVSKQGRRISRASFLRNVLFLLFCLCCLLVFIIVGRINLWGAISFVSLYVIYVIFILASETCGKEKRGSFLNSFDHDSSATLPMTDGLHDAKTPLLQSIVDENELVQVPEENNIITIYLRKIFSILELPLHLPRRLTIPLVSEERWSKPFAVSSVTLAPIALALIWNLNSINSGQLVYAIEGSIGIALGILVFFTTVSSIPPRKCLFLWLSGGFIMSISWTYVLAQELISLFVSMGLILGINHSILALTVLAWGNSLGDLVANVSMAINGGPGGAQAAICGSYAGPLFNTVVGLGLSLTISAWRAYPASYAILSDTSIFETIGFSILGLIWALIILPRNKMRLSWGFGCGLLAIYVCFLSLKIARTFGLLQINESSHSST